MKIFVDLDVMQNLFVAWYKLGRFGELTEQAAA